MIRAIDKSFYTLWNKNFKSQKNNTAADKFSKPCFFSAYLFDMANFVNKLSYNCELFKY